MHLDRRHGTGELTVAFTSEDFRRLLHRARECGTTPEALIERLTRDAYGHHVALTAAEEPRASASDD